MSQADFEKTNWNMIIAARRGDRQAMDYFANNYEKPIRAYIAKKIGRQDAEDVAQEFFTKKIFSGQFLKREWDQGQSFRSYLKRSLHYYCLDHLRKPASPSRQVPDDLPGEDVAQDMFDEEWIREVLQRTIDQMYRDFADETLWVVLVERVLRPTLHQVRAIKTADLAKKLGYSEPRKVDSLIERAKARFRKALVHSLGEYDPDSKLLLRQELHALMRVAKSLRPGLWLVIPGEEDQSSEPHQPRPSNWAPFIREPLWLEITGTLVDNWLSDHAAKSKLRGEARMTVREALLGSPSLAILKAMKDEATAIRNDHSDLGELLRFLIAAAAMLNHGKWLLRSRGSQKHFCGFVAGLVDEGDCWFGSEYMSVLLMPTYEQLIGRLNR